MKWQIKLLNKLRDREKPRSRTENRLRSTQTTSQLLSNYLSQGQWLKLVLEKCCILNGKMTDKEKQEIVFFTK